MYVIYVTTRESIGCASKERIIFCPIWKFFYRVNSHIIDRKELSVFSHDPVKVCCCVFITESSEVISLCSVNLSLYAAAASCEICVRVIDVIVFVQVEIIRILVHVIMLACYHKQFDNSIILNP